MIRSLIQAIRHRRMKRLAREVALELMPVPDPLADAIDGLARERRRRRQVEWEVRCRDSGTADSHTAREYGGGEYYIYTYPPAPPGWFDA